MSKKFRGFKCTSCDKENEKLVNDDVMSVYCECGCVMDRKISAPKCFSNSATCKGSSPSCR